MFIPYGVDRKAYEIAQERMYELNNHRDALLRLIAAVDKELEETIAQARKLLSEYPTLSLKARKAQNLSTTDSPEKS